MGLLVRAARANLLLVGYSGSAVHLSRHGVPVETEKSHVHKQDIGIHLLSLATTYGADMIVMGAYGRSRLREAVFGGATQHILGHMTVPVLLSH